jgi:hypothetical protein
VVIPSIGIAKGISIAGIRIARARQRRIRKIEHPTIQIGMYISLRTAVPLQMAVPRKPPLKLISVLFHSDV